MEEWSIGAKWSALTLRTALRTILQTKGGANVCAQRH